MLPRAERDDSGVRRDAVLVWTDPYEGTRVLGKR
jgi:hypothetical protein